MAVHERGLGVAVLVELLLQEAVVVLLDVLVVRLQLHQDLQLPLRGDVVLQVVQQEHRVVLVVDVVPGVLLDGLEVVLGRRLEVGQLVPDEPGVLVVVLRLGVQLQDPLEDLVGLLVVPLVDAQDGGLGPQGVDVVRLQLEDDVELHEAVVLVAGVLQRYVGERQPGLGVVGVGGQVGLERVHRPGGVAGGRLVLRFRHGLECRVAHACRRLGLGYKSAHARGGLSVISALRVPGADGSSEGRGQLRGRPGDDVRHGRDSAGDRGDVRHRGHRGPCGGQHRPLPRVGHDRHDTRVRRHARLHVLPGRGRRRQALRALRRHRAGGGLLAAGGRHRGHSAGHNDGGDRSLRGLEGAPRGEEQDGQGHPQGEASGFLRRGKDAPTHPTFLLYTQSASGQTQGRLRRLQSVVVFLLYRRDPFSCRRPCTSPPRTSP